MENAQLNLMMASQLMHPYSMLNIVAVGEVEMAAIDRSAKRDSIK